MALYHRLGLFKSSNLMSFSFSTSGCLSNKWRREQGLEECPRMYSPLTYLPDYSFVDGRPVPLSRRKLEKLNYQNKICERIVNLTQEIDVGLENYYKRLEEEKLRKETLIKNKLIPKGKALLEKKN